MEVRGGPALVLGKSMKVSSGRSMALVSETPGRPRQSRRFTLGGRARLTARRAEPPSSLDGPRGEATDEEPLQAEEHRHRHQHGDEGTGGGELPALAKLLPEVGQTDG